MTPTKWGSTLPRKPCSPSGTIGAQNSRNSRCSSKSGGAKIQEVEILVGDDLQDEAFKSVKKCSFINALVLKTPYQECSLPEATGRYVKVKVLSNNGGLNTYLTQIRLIGTLL